MIRWLFQYDFWSVKKMNYQAVELVISFQQVNPFSRVAGEPHAIRPLPLESPVLIHGDKSVGG